MAGPGARPSPETRSRATPRRARPLALALALLLAAGCGPPRAIAGPAAAPPATQRPPAAATQAASPIGPATPPPRHNPLPTAGLAATATSILLPSPTAIPEITLLFTGDINPARCVYAHAAEANDMALPYRALAEVLQGADITVGSLDGTLSDYNPPTPCIETTRNLLAPARMAEGLRFAGYDVMAVATNHIKDCGLVRGCVDEAMLDTLDNLRASAVEPAGAGQNLASALAPVIVTVQGVRFAFVAFTAINRNAWAAETQAGAAPLTRPVVEAAIRQARAQADVVIVLPHWGREYSADISWEQFEAAGQMVAAGAALVVGNHPHRVQGVETFPGGAVVAYALGNFVFDQEWSDGTQYTIQGLMLRAVFRGANLDRVELLPIHIYDDVQPRLAGPDEAAVILQDVATSMESAPQR
jgi:poly-gamma-glutamate capsule biosynthesis protein CapA/YwtB (metallophosphatase superfamily)